MDGGKRRIFSEITFCNEVHSQEVLINVVKYISDGWNTAISCRYNKRMASIFKWYWDSTFKYHQ